MGVGSRLRQHRYMPGVSRASRSSAAADQAAEKRQYLWSSRTPLPTGSDGKARRNNWVEAISGRTPRAKAGFIA